MDGRLQYELTLDAQKALAAVRGLEAAAARSGSSLAAVMQRALDRSEAAASGTREIADGLGAASNKAEDLAKQLNKSQGGMKTLALLAGGLALDVGGAALKAGGFDKTAGYVTSAAGSALQMALTAAMIGGKTAGVYGAVAGGVAGTAKEYFTQLFSENAAEIKSSEELRKNISEIYVATAAASRALATMETPKELQAAVTKINEKIIEIQDRAKNGLINPRIVNFQTASLSKIASEAEARIPAAERAEAEARAARNLALVRDVRYASSEGRERSQFGMSLDNARTAAEKIEVIDRRFAELASRAKILSDALDSDAVLRGPEERVSALASQLVSAEAELDRLTETRADVARGGSGKGGDAARLVNEWQRLGGFMGGGSMTSMSDSISRAAAADARRTADALERIERRSMRGGSVWAP